MIFFVFVFVISALFDFVQPASLVPPASPVSKVSHQLENTLSSGFKLYLGVLYRTAALYFRLLHSTDMFGN